MRGRARVRLMPMPSLSLPLRASAGLAFFALMAAAVAALTMVGFEDAAPAEQWRAAVEANRAWAGLAGVLLALAGLGLAAFVEALHALLARDGPGLARWGRYAGHAWAALFLAGGAFVASTVEMAGHQQHAEGTKTMLVLGLVFLNPVSVLVGGALALAVGMAARASRLPRWFAWLGIGGGGLALAVTPLAAIGGIGNVGLAPLVLWLLVAAAAAPWLARRAPGA